ncbi:MAG: TfoX/Sxy family protein [Rhodospirillaceae bacterium]
MASRQETAGFLLDQLRGLRVSAKKMFGEYGVYCDGKIVALVCDDQLFVKPTAAGRSLIGKVREAPPYPGAKPYFLIEDLDDAEALSELIRVTARELPPPKAKTTAKTRKETRSKRASIKKRKAVL